MSILIKAAYFAASRARALVAGAIAAFAAMTATPSFAAVEYVKVCDAFGAGFFYIPGTETCVNANQIVNDEFAITRAVTRASTGTAMAAALVNPFLPEGTNYAISTHWAVFNGQHAVGFAGLMRLWGNLAFSAGVSLGLDRGQVLTLTNRTPTGFGPSLPLQSWSELRAMARVGLEYSW